MRHLNFIWIFILCSCGAAYNSPSVIDGPGVRLVDMTSETIAEANRSPYSPRELPEVFNQTAGVGSGLRSISALPEAVLPAQRTPQAVQSRLPPPTAPGPYKIGVGDVVLLATPESGSTVAELSGLLAAQNSRQGYTVQGDGSINIPNVGRVLIANMTIDAAEAELFQKLVANQLDPTFSLEVAEFNSRKVTIGGAVATPTVLPIALTSLSLNEALVKAGGTTLQGQDDGVVRLYRDGSLYQMSLDALLSNAGMQQILLQDGDSVYVDASYELTEAQAYFEQQITLTEVRQRARDVALRELTTEVELRRSELEEARDAFRARSELGAVARDYVYIMGEVGAQSRYPLPFEQTANLADALFDAGSGVPLDTGDVSQIYLLRATPAPGAPNMVTAMRLDGRNAQNFTLATQMQLRPNDIIFVAEQPVTRWNRVVQQITPSLITSGAAAVN